MVREGLVSTIIPVHNRALLLHDAVNSVLAQAYRPIEIIVVDDGSTDDTPEAVRGLVNIHPVEVRAIRIANGGPGAAREAGRQVASGEFIQYLDSDDLLDPRKFERQVDGLRFHASCDVSYGRTRFYSIGDAPNDSPWKRTGEDIATMFPSFLQSRWWDTSTPLYRRTVTDRAGAWTHLRTEEDWEYDCRIAALDVRLHNCREVVSDTRQHGGTLLSRDRESAATLSDRAEAHRLILQHARAAGTDAETPEMKHFARELFLLARQCGVAGLDTHAAGLFRLARFASTMPRSYGPDYLGFRCVVALLGWRRAGRLAATLDRVRPFLSPRHSVHAFFSRRHAGSSRRPVEVTHRDCET